MQHMCRFVIRKHVRLDHIDSLPLPKRLKDYLKEAQYYTQDDILHWPLTPLQVFYCHLAERNNQL